MKARQGKAIAISLIGAAVALVLLILFVEGQEIPAASHAKTYRLLGHLKELDTKLNKALYESRVGATPHYDNIVATTSELSTTLAALEAGLPTEIKGDLDSQIAAVREVMVTKFRIIEGFKSHQAVLRNSLNYIPLGIENTVHDLGNFESVREIEEKLRLLKSMVFQYQITRTKSLSDNLQIELERLNTFATLFPRQGQKDALLTLLRHFRIATDYAVEVDSYLSALESLPTGRTIDRLFVTYADRYEAKSRLATIYRQLTFVFALALAVGIVFLLRILIRTSSQLEGSVEELSFQKYAMDQHAIVSIADRRGNIIYANDKFCALSGYSREELIGKNHRIVKSDEHSTEFFRELWQTISKGKVWHGQVKNQSKDGDIYWVESTIVPLLDSSRRPFQYISIRTDITAQKKLESELEGAKAAADSANIAKGQFLANMSHEIRTPMNAIIGLSNLALKTHLNRQQKDYVGKIHSSGKALLRLINDILDFSKIEAGKLEIERVPFSLEQVISEACVIASLSAEEKSIDLVVDTPLNLDTPVLGDPLRVSQVLINLLNNAVKFTTKGHVALLVTTQNLTGSKYIFEFSVKDTGIGIPEDAVLTLFSSFSQADTSTTRKFGGTGLGLSIVKRLVTLMGGEIRVESEVGEGSTFTVSIPIELTELKDPEKDETRLSGLSAAIMMAGKLHQTVLEKAVTAAGSDLVKVSSNTDLSSLLSPNNRRKLVALDILLVDDTVITEEQYDTWASLYRQEQDLPLLAIVKSESGTDRTWLDEQFFLTKPLIPSITINQLADRFHNVDTQSALVPTPSSKQINLFGHSVLLVEDNEINQQIARELLRGMGLTVATASNGQEAVDYIAVERFDLVLMDVQMPVLDGFKATAEIRKDKSNADLPIVAMTANAMLGDKERCLEAGMNDYISKPIDTDELAKVLNRYLSESSERQPEPESAQSHEESSVNLKAPSLTVLDLDKGLKTVAGNATLYDTLLARVISAHEADGEKLASVRDAVPASAEVVDEELLRTVHTLKSVAASIGALLLEHHAGNLEVNLRSGKFDAYPEEIDQVTSALEETIRYIRARIE